MGSEGSSGTCWIARVCLKTETPVWIVYKEATRLPPHFLSVPYFQTHMFMFALLCKLQRVDQEERRPHDEGPLLRVHLFHSGFVAIWPGARSYNML